MHYLDECIDSYSSFYLLYSSIQYLLFRPAITLYNKLRPPLLVCAGVQNSWALRLELRVVGGGGGARQGTTGWPSVASETMDQASQPAASTLHRCTLLEESEIRLLCTKKSAAQAGMVFFLLINACQIIVHKGTAPCFFVLIKHLRSNLYYYILNVELNP